MANEPKERFRFQYGPRDNGPATPPPWHQRVQFFMGIILMFGAGAVGVNYEWIGGVFMRGPCALLCGVGLMICMGFVGDGMDKARADGDFDEPYNHDK